LFVRSFENLENTGTKVSKGIDLYPNTVFCGEAKTDFSFDLYQ
jgi:hypothetical protein